jgi:predicted alpha/beta superfamily hydrolase
MIVSQNICAQDKTDVIIGKKYTMHSTILKEDRAYWIQLPQHYHHTVFSPKKYPVLILLDGDRQFHFATGLIEFLSVNQKIPDMIVIGLPNTDRTRDLTPTHIKKGYDGKEHEMFKTSGGGDQFLRFIHEELLPKIDSTYRTMSYKILAGHSFGGTLTLHSFLSKQQKFNMHIAMDPSVWWDDRYLVRRVKADSIIKRNYKSSLYISVAHNTISPIDTSENRKSIEDFYSVLMSNSLSTLNAGIQYFEDDDHGSVPLMSLYKGLEFSFKGYHLPNIYERDVSDIKEHYEIISQKFGITFLPPEELINQQGYYNLYETKDYDKALAFFAYNTSIYPDAFNVYDSQGEAYKVMGNTKKAIEYYKKSLELNPENKYAIKIINELKAERKKQ